MKDSVQESTFEFVASSEGAKGDRVQASRLSRLGLSIYVVVALAAIFLVPRLVSTPASASDSYLFGYNNRVGIVLLFLFLAIAAVWTRGLNLAVAEEGVTPRLSRGLLLISLAFAGLTCLVMYSIAGRYCGFGESFYLIDRIWLLHNGRVPYRDFEFAYGPVQLYGPLLLQKILHLELAPSYYLFWATSYLAGTYFLFKAVDLVEFRTKAKPWIFAFLFLAGLFAIIRLGTNYTFLRYALPVYLVVVFQRRLTHAHTTSPALTWLAAMVFSGILILISPEMAVAFAWASIGIWVLHRESPLRFRLSLAACVVLGNGLLFWVALKLHVFDAMLADGGGAISFPILPGPTILAYFVALSVCACWLYRTLLNRSGDQGTLGLILFSMPMAAAALGRCDPSHVFWNGLSAFFATLLYLSNYRRAWVAFAAAFLVGVALLPNASEFYLFMPQLRSARFFNKHPEVRPTEGQITTFLSSWAGDYIAPFGYRPDGFGTYHSPRIEFGRFEDLIDVSTPHSVDEKVSEMRKNPRRALILPYHADEYCHINQRAESHFLETLLLFPYVGKIVHPDFVREPICRYMSDHYRMIVEPTVQTYWYGIWEPLSSVQ